MEALTILVFAFGMVQSIILIERIDHTDNQDYFTSNYSIVNNSGRSAVSLDAIMYKTWGMRLTFRCKFFSLGANKPRLIMAFPKFFYCDIMRTTKDVPFVIHMMEQFATFGNLSLTCPVYKSARYLRNYYIDGKNIPLFKTLTSNCRYMGQLVFDDEAGKAPINIFRMKIFFKYLKS